MSLPGVEYVAVERLHVADWNPRQIEPESFAALCRSLEADPEFLESRPILANLEGEVFAGNHRLLAARHLGWEVVPAILADVPPDLARRRGLLDNNTFAAWDETALGALLATIQADGDPVDALGFGAAEVARLLALADGADDGAVDWPDLPTGEKPPFEQMTFTLSTAQAGQVREAIETAKAAGSFDGSGNDNSNGNALARVAAFYTTNDVEG